MADQTCRHCGMIHGPRCPYVKAIEYYSDGTLKRVEFHGPAAPLPDLLTQPYRFDWQPNTSVRYEATLYLCAAKDIVCCPPFCADCRDPRAREPVTKVLSPGGTDDLDQ